MKVDLDDDELNLVVEALEHLYAYTRAAQREDSRYRELADRLKRSVARDDALEQKISRKKKR